jgi:glycerol kinase
MRYILGIDQGTTATKALLVDQRGRVSALAQRILSPLHPQPGWVELEPEAIWRSVVEAATEALAAVPVGEVVALGLANQGETVIAWDRRTGESLYNAITWQCARTAERCRALASPTTEEMIRQRTGLLLDPYFSASKLQWLLENVPAVQRARDRGTLGMGTLDSWLIWRMSGGRAFVTDYATASRTMLLNVHTLDWDNDLLALFAVPREALPQPMPCASSFGASDPRAFGLRAPIMASAVDQPAALWGHGCRRAGECKITYGTGAFLLMNIGERFRVSQRGLLTSIAVTAPGQPIQYYLDGGIYSVGAAVEWLKEGLGVLADPAESGRLAASLPDSGGVYFVPALGGMAAPHWDRAVRGAFFGLTAATGRVQIVRAALEAIAFRVLEVVRAMEQDSGQRIMQIQADGGVARNDFLMQFQADLLGVPVCRVRGQEMTALGIAHLAGLASGFWHDDLLVESPGEIFQPNAEGDALQRAFMRWQEAVRLAKAFGNGR